MLRLWRCLRGREEAGARAAELGGVLGRGLGAVGGDRRRRRLGSDALRGLRLTARGPSRSRGGARVPGGGEQWLSKRRRDYSVRRRGETSPVSVGQMALKRWLSARFGRIHQVLTDRRFSLLPSPEKLNLNEKSVTIRIIGGITGYYFVIELVSRFLIGLEEINAEVSVSVKDF